jgi:hypothetical protein
MKDLNINVRTIPHDQQRYPTVGDWWYDFETNTWEIRVSDMGDWRYEALVAIHEEHEVLAFYYKVCNKLTIEEMVALVDNFDIQFEKERAAGKHTPEDEPGDDPNCPVVKEHFFATNLERLFAIALGVDWNEYSKAVEALPGYEPDGFTNVGC